MATRCVLGLIWIVSITLLIVIDTTFGKNEKNHKMFSSLGLVKLPISPNHYRKRLAVDARHYSRSDDSHMFIIKLPPKPHYYMQSYTHPKIAKDKYSVGFTSNGQPKGIYHWNIPVLKKIVTKNRSRNADSHANDVTDAIWNRASEKHTGLYPKMPTYYVPAKPKKSLHKYFPGNGKPHSFYVIEKSKKAHFHKLLP